MRPKMVCYTQLDLLDRQIEGSQATEANKIFVSVIDAAIRVFNNIKTSLLEIFSTFKRSELRAWRESHTIAFKSLMDDKPIALMKELVHIPQHMSVTYGEAINVIDKDLTKLDIEKTIDKFLDYLDKFDEVIKQEDKSFLVAYTKKFTSEINRLTQSDLDDSFNKVFSEDQRAEKRTFKEVIETYRSIDRINTHIGAYEELFKLVPVFCQKIGTIEKRVRAHISDFENQEAPDKALIKAFRDLIHTFAIQCDALGVILHHIQRIEHNWVLALDHLTKTHMDKDK